MTEDDVREVLSMNHMELKQQIYNLWAEIRLTESTELSMRACAQKYDA